MAASRTRSAPVDRRTFGHEVLKFALLVVALGQFEVLHRHQTIGARVILGSTGGRHLPPATARGTCPICEKKS